MRKTSLFVLASGICLMSQNMPRQTHAQQTTPPPNTEVSSATEPSEPSAVLSNIFADALTPRAYLPVVIGGTKTVTGSCGITSTMSYGLIGIDGGFYKNNTLTDENADFRLSVISYEPASALLSLVDYGGDADGDAPRLHGVFEPNRLPVFVRAHKRYDWNWNESGLPPYGSRGGVNNDWDVSVIEFGATAGEAIHIPERSPEIGSAFNAMVLYASATELTLTYQRSDGVGNGYVIHLHGFCVDPNLIALYRAQLDGGGKRKTGLLPALKNNQRVGTASGNALAIAIRDNGAFLDPRSKKDWWQALS